MHKFLRYTLLPAFAAMLLLATAHGDEGLENLKIFKSGGMQHGKWQMEILDGSDASMQQMMQRTGKMSVCLDIARQMAKQYQHDNTQGNSCTHKVIRNTASSAELEADCTSGSRMHSVITREDDKNYLIDGTMTSKDNKIRHLKARYTYLGECSDEGAVQFDKDSPACKMMREKTKGVDMSAMCARLQDKMREQCEQNIKNMQASCQ